MPVIYRVTIDLADKEDRYRIAWQNANTGAENYFEADAGEITAGMEGFWHQPGNHKRTGRELFRFLDGADRHLQKALDEANRRDEPLLLLVKTCNQAADWPLELLAKDNDFLLHRQLHLVRRVSERGSAKIPGSPNRPLKLLFMASSPLEVPGLDELGFEKEEEDIFNITAGLPIEMEVEDSGSLAGLQEQLRREPYDVVHLTGHAGLDKNGMSYLVMEDETGSAKFVYPPVLWQDALVENPPRLLFLSGCRTGEIPGDTPGSAAFSFSYNLVERYDIPALLGWGRPVEDWQASLAAQVLYRELTRGQSVLEAVQRTRIELALAFPLASTPAWPLLRLFSSGVPLAALVKKGQKPQPVTRKLAHTYLACSRVRVLANGFIGRRRPLQRSLRALRRDDAKTGALLLGTAGLGKSCLAGKICERFAKHTLVIVHGIFNTVTLENALQDAFVRARSEEGKQILGQNKTAVDKLADMCVSCFKEKNYLFLLDDFEQNLEGAAQGSPGPILPEAAELLRALLHYLPYSGKMTRMLVTSRYPFSLVEQGRDLVKERLEFIWLTGFRETEQRKKVLELPHISRFPDRKVVPRLVSAGCGNPRLMEWLDLLVSKLPGAKVPELLAAAAGKKEEFIRTYVLRELVKQGGAGMPGFLALLCIYRRPVLEKGIEAVTGKTGIKNRQELLEAALGLSLVEHDQARQSYQVTPLLREELLPSATRNLFEKRFLDLQKLLIIDNGTRPLPDLQKLLVECHEAAFGYYGGVCENQEEIMPQEWEEWIYHALACGREEEASNQGGRLVTHLGERLAFLESRRVGEWVLAEKKQPLTTGADAFLLNEVASTIDTLGEHRQAISYYEQALAIDRAVYGEAHPDVAIDLNNLGLAWKALGDYNKAISYYEQALAIDRAVYGEAHPDVAIDLNNLGSLYLTRGQKDQAKVCLDKAYEILHKFLGPDHPHTKATAAWLEKCR